MVLPPDVAALRPPRRRALGYTYVATTDGSKSAGLDTTRSVADISRLSGRRGELRKKHETRMVRGFRASSSVDGRLGLEPTTLSLGS